MDFVSEIPGDGHQEIDDDTALLTVRFSFHLIATFLLWDMSICCCARYNHLYYDIITLLLGPNELTSIEIITFYRLSIMHVSTYVIYCLSSAELLNTHR